MHERKAFTNKKLCKLAIKSRHKKYVEGTLRFFTKLEDNIENFMIKN